MVTETSPGAQNDMRLSVRTELQDPTGDRPHLAAYAFDSAGTLLARAPIDATGEAALSLPSNTAGDMLRVMVGPDLEGAGQQQVGYESLNRAGGTEKRIALLPDNAGAELQFQIPDVLWRCWFPHRCHVRGQVVKRIYAHGNPIDLPICNGHVCIYEVDPLVIILDRLPDNILNRIKFALLRPPVLGPPDPPDPPIDFADSAQRPFENLFRAFQAQNSAGRAASAEPALSLLEHHARSRADSLPAVQTAQSLSSSDFLRQLSFADGLPLRQLLKDNAALIKPYLCLWPWWIWYHTQQLICIDLDEDGRFETDIFLGCGLYDDRPDLYFTVEQEINGTPTLIYDPPIPCNTHWNYVCGTDVTLVVTDPRAVTCQPGPVLPDGGVTILCVGQTSLSTIFGAGAEDADMVPLTTTNIGLIDSYGGTIVNAPFGGRLDLRVDFGTSLRYRPNPDQPEYYYRWSYRPYNSGSDWTQITASVDWHYRLQGGADIMYPTKNLGPNLINTTPNLYEVPYFFGPNGNPWSVLNVRTDLASGYFDSQLIAPAPGAGKYELRLEIFDKNGVKLDPTVNGIDFRMPDPSFANSRDLTGVVHTASAVTTDPLGQPGNLTVADAHTTAGDFTFVVHIDNNGTTAIIDAPQLSSGVQTDPCGFLRYAGGETVAIAYHAIHPNRHATYSYGILKGTPPDIYDAGGEVGAGSFSVLWPPNPPGHTPSVGDLLGGCAEAAFGMNLWVWGKATDGWSRLGYDAFATRAFALAQA
jgi:hypothetical protein